MEQPGIGPGQLRQQRNVSTTRQSTHCVNHDSCWIIETIQYQLFIIHHIFKQSLNIKIPNFVIRSIEIITEHHFWADSYGLYLRMDFDGLWQITDLLQISIFIYNGLLRIMMANNG